MLQHDSLARCFSSVMRSFINLGDFSCQSKELASTNNTDLHQAISYSVIPLTLNFSSDKNCLLTCIPCGACATAEFVWSNTMLSHLDTMPRPAAHALKKSRYGWLVDFWWCFLALLRCIPVDPLMVFLGGKTYLAGSSENGKTPRKFGQLGMLMQLTIWSC